MIFDFLRNFFTWLHEGAKKRKSSEDSSFEDEHVPPPLKKQKTDCSKAFWADDYSDTDDDIDILSEQKFPLINSCVKLNGTHIKESQPYQFHATSTPNVYKSACSPRYENSTMSCFTKQRCKMQDTDQKYLTLCKTNQMKEKYQYQELLQNFLPSKVQILKDKPVEQASAQEIIEVIDLDKDEPRIEKTPFTNKSRQIQFTNKSPQESPLCWHNRSRATTSNSKTDKGRVPTLEHNAKDRATYFHKFTIPKMEKPPDGKATKFPFATKSPSFIKPVAINSLRDELATKMVMRQDFIPEVTQRYNERLNQRHREVEELKRMTCALSKHNRYTREAALGEQLARSMKQYLAILDEREEPEEPPLPRLTDEMLREIKSALVPCPPDEILIEDFGLRITRKDLHTLSGLNWLNDEVINFYMNLLIARGTTDNCPKVYAMNTFFYPKLLSSGHSSLKRWTRKVDLFAKDLVVVPIHLDIHWCMSIIDFRDKSIVYYDSMGTSNPKCLAALKQYLQDESLDKKKQPYDMSDWKLQSAKDIPQQMNGSDCGVFSCMFAEYVCANKRITFTQQDMPYFRHKMAYEILNTKLL